MQSNNEQLTRSAPVTAAAALAADLADRGECLRSLHEHPECCSIPTQATIDATLTLEWLAKRPDFQAYAAQFHTTTAQLVELATKARPRLLILYHSSLSLRPAVDSERSTPAALMREMSGYPGQLVIGQDLDVY